ncbi:MAG: hypothetical protein ABW098_09665 [Candidatus Thiodiazotropha sp.]
MSRRNKDVRYPTPCLEQGAGEIEVIDLTVILSGGSMITRSNAQ